MMGDCQESRRLSAYHDGELPVAEAQQVERHLSLCATCREELAELQRLSGWLADAALDVPSPSLESRLHRQVDRLTRERPLRRLADALAAAAAIIVTVCGLQLWWRVEHPPARPALAPAPWEHAAAALQVEDPGTGGEATLAQWVVNALEDDTQ